MKDSYFLFNLIMSAFAIIYIIGGGVMKSDKREGYQWFLQMGLGMLAVAAFNLVIHFYFD